MKRHSLRNILFLGVVACVIGAGAIAVSSAAPRAYGEEWHDIALLSEYERGAEFTVPKRVLNVGGKSTEAVSQLVFPNGTTTLKTNVSLDTAGNYTLVYTAAIDGKVYRTEEKFEVYEPLIDVGEDSSVKYEKHVHSASTEGLSVRLAEFDTLRFTQIIDITQCDLSEPIVEFFVTPDVIGVHDFGLIEFRLTDIENPDKYLRIVGNRSADGVNSPYTYFLTGGENQVISGWQGGYWNILHVDNGWGTDVYHSFYGRYDGATALDGCKVRIYYDYANNSVYVGDSNGKYIVADLDNGEYFRKLWYGFDSGKVRLSVTAGGYTGTSANFVVTKVKGMDLTQKKTEDVDPPTIVIDKPSAMPAAKTGVKYDLPQATAFDDYSGEVSVETRVYYNYTTDDPIDVAVTDGAFVPIYGGMYAVVYVATDNFGNPSTQVVWVEASGKLDDLTVAVDPAGKITQATAGDKIVLPGVEVAGGSGEYSISVAVTANGKTVDVKGGSFIIDEVATHTVTFTATDYVGQTASASYEIAVDGGDTPVFIDEPQLPLYFISGSEYRLPPLVARDYTSGARKEKQATLSVSDGAGTRTVSGTFTPTVKNNGDEVTLEYDCDGVKLVKKVTCIIPKETGADEIRRLKIENYFVSDGASVQTGAESAIVTAQRTDGEWTFANPQLAADFQMTVAAVPAKSKFGGIKITLADSVDRSVAVEVRLLYSGGKTVAIVGDESAVCLSGFQASASKHSFVIGYYNGRITVDGNGFDVKTTADGKPFSGFKSDKLYVSAAFIDAKLGAAYAVENINGQPITDTSTDRIRPKIVIVNEPNRYVPLGAEARVGAAVSADVLDPNIEFTVTLTDPDGNTVTSKDGVVLDGVSPNIDYTFIGEKFGRYTVVYSSTDGFGGRAQELEYSITVEDRDPPEITMNQTPVTTVKVGNVFVIPDFTVVDNCAATEDIVVIKYIRTATGAYEHLPEQSNSFRPTQAGNYRLVINAIDPSGNLGVYETEFTVTE